MKGTVMPRAAKATATTRVAVKPRVRKTKVADTISVASLVDPATIAALNKTIIDYMLTPKRGFAVDQLIPDMIRRRARRILEARMRALKAAETRLNLAMNEFWKMCAGYPTPETAAEIITEKHNAQFAYDQAHSSAEQAKGFLYQLLDRQRIHHIA